MTELGFLQRLIWDDRPMFHFNSFRIQDILNPYTFMRFPPVSVIKPISFGIHVHHDVTRCIHSRFAYPIVPTYLVTKNYSSEISKLTCSDATAGRHFKGYVQRRSTFDFKNAFLGSVRDGIDINLIQTF